MYVTVLYHFPEGLDYIVERAFSGCTSLLSITLPKNLWELDSVFNGCSSLNLVVLPDGQVRRQGSCQESLPGGIKNEFNGCTSLASISLPESLDLLEGSFNGCTSLTSVTLPEGLENCAQCFDDCTSLISVTMQSSIYLCCSFFGCTSLTTLTLLGSGRSSGIFTGPAQIENQINEMEVCFNCGRGTRILSPMDGPESG